MALQTSTAQELARFVKQQALQVGFSAVGIAKVEKLDNIEGHFKQWLAKGMNGKMGYLQKNIEKRLDPTLLLEGARTIIVVALNYYPAQRQNPQSKHLVSKYACGADYHGVIKKKLHGLADILKQRVPQLEYRAFVDSAPLFEKEWAARAGLGWIGKNSCFLIPRKGSFFFLGELVCNLDLATDQPSRENLCGNCTKCLDACPTKAIIEPGVVDASKCISYLTIELKDNIPQQYRGKTEGWIFGCDACQDACPHNKFAQPTTEKELGVLPLFGKFGFDDWENLDEKTYKEVIRKAKSPLSRIKYQKLRDNIAANSEQRKI